jgi:hypothetical protein
MILFGTGVGARPALLGGVGQVETRLANMPPCLIGWKPALAHIT